MAADRTVKAALTRLGAAIDASKRERPAPR